MSRRQFNAGMRRTIAELCDALPSKLLSGELRVKYTEALPPAQQKART